jgi:hypothetical protein
MARRKSLRFRCPNCGTLLEKGYFARNLEKLEGFIPPGRESMSCPSCRRPIDTRKMVNGDYDEPEFGGLGLLILLAALFGLPYLLYAKAKLNLWVSIGVSYAAIFVGIRIFGSLFRRSRRPDSK